ncbi:glycoside hydrolase family 31 protein [Streptomyces sp. N2-109]|uniref:Glycoside hydrolase family 31 protein n=1 Tax=Streptomyces gossypii TaxID=2883101 RepID=A0ABT2K2Y6_9ACTN|nr:glycoside hydrolase family 31 protein [Streptomyces gossypii]MCT2594540.1 glycoside hydrolase family 31 protein [Streptomyces gossypii]
MDARGLVRSVRAVGTPLGVRTMREAWRRHRTDAAGLPRPRAERARVPGAALGAEPSPGGGVIRFARSSLRVRVAVGGAVFCGWDGAAPEPSYALAGPCPEADPRAGLEPDKNGGWRVVSERVMVTVSRHGGVEVRTPGGVMLRRELPPRWWEPADGTAGGHWAQRSQVTPDARFFGLGGRAVGPRLPDGAYRLWNSGPGTFDKGPDPLSLTMPVQLVVADVGSHLVFHDNTWDGRVTLRQGSEGAGSGHDRPGRCEVRMSGGPLRYWVVTGPPARILHGWVTLTGAPALPPDWALGHQHARWGSGAEARQVDEVRRTADGYREHGLPLHAMHLDIDDHHGHRLFADGRDRFPRLPELASELRERGVRLVPVVDPAVRVQPGSAVYDSGAAADVFVRDSRGRQVRGAVWPGRKVFPDFTDPGVRKWWGGLYTREAEPVSFASFAALADRTLPLSARHALEGRGGDHREAHNVYGLAMARAGHDALRELRPAERPFLFSRSGWAGMQRYGGAWSGAVRADWPGLRASLALVLGLGLCGVPYSGPDIGGFTGSPSPELYLRWFQLGAYLPLFRTHSAKGAGRRAPWEFGPEVLEGARAALERRERLLPYLVTLAHLAHRTGAPYARPLWWQHSRDRALRDCDDAFLLGDALLVAPVLEQGVVRRTVRLPRGRWYDTATGEAYEGPARVEIAAPPARIPVLARAGAAIPVAGAEGGTELEVWAPAPGRTGSGLVISDAGEGWQRPLVERLTVRMHGAETVVTREDGTPVVYPVRVRG